MQTKAHTSPFERPAERRRRRRRSIEEHFQPTLRLACRTEPVMFTPEKLESRRLLSVNVDFNSLTGQLDVTGIGKSMDVRVTMLNTEQRNAGMKAKLSSQLPAGLANRPGPLLNGVSVYDGLNLVFNSVAKGANVTDVNIQGTFGKDNVSVYAWNSLVPSRFFGNEGDDTVWSTAANALATKLYGEGGDDDMHLVFSDRAQFEGPEGGAGNDVIDVFGSVLYDPMLTSAPTSEFGTNCDVRARVIDGGDGNDVIKASLEFGDTNGFGYAIFGGAGDDVITGSAYADQLYGDDGNDEIYAGAGDDYLNGGLGDDTICGEDGDDFLDHGGGIDVVDGGAGRDIAVADKGDELIDIEELI